MSLEVLDGLTAALLAGLAGAVIFSLLGLVSGTDETATLAPLTLAVVLLGVPPAGVLTFFIAGAAAKHMTHAVPTTLLGIPGDTMAIAVMEEANYLRRLGVPHVALRKMISAALIAALIAVPVAVLAASLLANVADDLREVVPYLFPVIAIAIAYLSRGRWASVLALVPLTAMITGLNSYVLSETGKTLAISFFVGLAIGPMIIDLVGLSSPLTRQSLVRDRRPTFWLAPEASEPGRRRMPNPLTVLNRKETRDTAVAATVTSLTFVVSPLAMAILVGDVVGSRVKHAYQRLTRVISVRNGVTDSTYLAETLIPLVAIGLPLSPIAAGAAAPLFNAPPVYTVGGDGVELNNLHTMLTAPQFLIFGLVGVVLAGLVAYPLTVRYARGAALFVARRLSHEAVIGAFAGLVLVVAMYEGGFYGVIVMLTVGLVGGILNKVIGMHVGVQCMAYYVSVLSVPVLLG
ncbi:tripartite tricarboxylate transporter permease [Nocardioides lijunqiniae]|uniref:tripartite tricarboxylate transporter permease n=1 Tax=Nocardioides lijunqiniae TaxID=2760832 RepID=UPI001877BCD4|nr:tripartite tricarboxylate transporter permease [Nocardioides lijunqiniae]